MKGENNMKIKKMPITVVLLVISYFIAALGVFLPVFLFVSKGINWGALIWGSLALLLSLIMSAVIRMFANIGQIIFDTKQEIQTIRRLNNTSVQHLFSLNQDLKTELKNQTLGLEKNINNLNQDLKTELKNQNLELEKIIRGLNHSLSSNISSLSQDLVSEIKSLTSNLQNLSASCEQINCDSKDLNQNINQIKNFFEQIEKHLDLKQ